MQGVDSVLYCTGYQYAYPWLIPPDLLMTEGMRVDPLYKHVLHPVVGPTLAFVGLLSKNVPYPQMEMQVRTLTTCCGAWCCCRLCLIRAEHHQAVSFAESSRGKVLCVQAMPGIWLLLMQGNEPFQSLGAACSCCAQHLCMACRQMSRHDVLLCLHASACFARHAGSVRRAPAALLQTRQRP